MSLPVYSRADLSRTVALVVALSLTAVSTGAVARERAADTQGKELNRSNVAVAPIGIFGPATTLPAGTAPVSHPRTSVKGYSSANAEHDPAAARPIERISKVE